FYRRTGHRLLWLVALITMGTYIEAFGILLFFPLFIREASSSQSPVGIVQDVFRALHLAQTPRAVLPVIVAVFLLRALLQFLSIPYQHVLSAEMARTTRTQLVSSFCQSAYRHTIRVPSGYVTNLITSEVTRSAQAFVAFSRTLPPVVNITVFVCI